MASKYLKTVDENHVDDMPFNCHTTSHFYTQQDTSEKYERTPDSVLQQLSEKEATKTQVWTYEQRRELHANIVDMMTHEHSTAPMRVGLLQVVANAEPSTRGYLLDQLELDSIDQIELDLEDCDCATLDKMEDYIRECINSLNAGTVCSSSSCDTANWDFCPDVTNNDSRTASNPTIDSFYEGKVDHNCIANHTVPRS